MLTIGTYFFESYANVYFYTVYYSNAFLMIFNAQLTKPNNINTQFISTLPAYWGDY